MLAIARAWTFESSSDTIPLCQSGHSAELRVKGPRQPREGVALGSFTRDRCRLELGRHVRRTFVDPLEERVELVFRLFRQPIEQDGELAKLSLDRKLASEIILSRLLAGALELEVRSALIALLGAIGID